MVWSVRVTSQQLLSDRGYAIEYTLEFPDEEELRVRGLGGQEILSGRVRTILDGEPAEIEIHLRNERMPLAIYQDGGRVVAAWKGPARLIPIDLRRDEVERRRNLMLELLAETRARLGLARFRPSETLRVRLRLADLGAIAFVPIGADVEMYEIVRPTTARAVENLVAEIDGFRCG